MNNKFDYDVFIAYHGTYNKNGSLQKAKEIYRILSDNGVNCYFFYENRERGFSETTQVVHRCRKFILVANENIAVYKDDGSIEINKGIYEEVRLFKNCIYDDQFDQELGDARVYGFGGLTSKKLAEIMKLEKEGVFVPIFQGVAHFFEENGKARAMEDLLDWAKGCTKKTSGRSNDTKPASRAYSLSSVLETVSNWNKQNLTMYLSKDDIGICSNFLRYFMKRTNGGLFPEDLDKIADKVIGDAKRGHKRLLKVVGGKGSGKTLLLEVLYQSLVGREPDTIPFIPCYINVQLLYEKAYDKRVQPVDILNTDIEPILKELLTLSKNIKKEPLFIISGISKSDVNDSLEYKLKQMLERDFNCFLIVGIDDKIVNSIERERPRVIYNNDRFSLEIMMDAIPKSERAKCAEAIRLYTFLPGVNADESELADAFDKMDFYMLDLFILRLIDEDNKHSSNLNKMLDGYCYEHLFANHGNNFKDQAAEFAFMYSYTHRSVSSLEKDDLHALTLFRHRIIVDYFVAVHYVNKLYELSIENSDIVFFEQILPKESTRFVVPMINGDNTLEKKIIDLITVRYKDMGHLCKSEMHYFLGRLKSPRFRAEAKNILHKLFRECRLSAESKLYVEQEDIDDKIELFLFRSVAVNLAYCGDQEAAEKYVSNMIFSKAANEINKGFHLEYYGDKPFMPTIDSLDFNDVPSIGEKTMSELVRSLKKERARAEFSTELSPSIKIVLFTLCSLIQTRMYNASFSQEKLKEFAAECLSALKEFKKNNRLAGSGVESSYYDMVIEDFGEFIVSGESADKTSGMLCRMVTLIDSLAERPRSGWVKYDIEDPESISEHMYGCWLIGVLFLPGKYSAEPDYSKESILKLLLIHDWAESITGDIRMTEKTKHDRQKETEIMNMLLLKGTYPDIADMDDFYQLWNDYESENSRSINSKIVKDIDSIQALFRFCHYYLANEDKFGPKKPSEWFEGYRRNIQTQIGWNLYKKIIVDNVHFEPIMRLLPKEWRA